MRVSAPLTVLMVVLAGCGDPAVEPPVNAHTWISEFGVEITPASTRVSPLVWHEPSVECLQVYRIETEYDSNPMHEQATTSELVVGPSPRNPQRQADQTRPVSAGEVFSGRVYYRGFRVADEGMARELYLSAQEAGPAAPTAACLPKTWDPIEDALALGWPGLTGRLTALGESWNGLRVEAKCNKSACIDPVEMRGGPDSHHRPCITMSWQERLVGIYESGGERLVAIESSWHDGHEKAGIYTERRALLSADHGRPVWATTTVHHGFPTPLENRTFGPINRTWTLTAIDGCPGSLAALGWSRDPDTIATAQERAAAFRNFDAQAKKRRKSRATRDNAGTTTGR